MVQLVGTLIVGAVFVQAVLVLWASVQRLLAEGAHQRAASALLEERVGTARAGRAELEQAREFGSWKGYRKFEVKRRHRETKDICSFYLAPHDGKPLPPFRPGQYLTVQLQVPDPYARRRSVKPTVRCYSLSNGPNERYYRISVKRTPPADEHLPGLASNFFHGRVSVHDILDVQAPRGNFALDLERQAPVVLIAGGVGVTPLLSMLNTLVTRGSEREVWFFYGVRRGAEAMRLEQLEQWARRHYWLRLHVCYSQADPGDITNPALHHASRISTAMLQGLLPSNNYDFYLCGPPAMMESLSSGLRAWGVPDDHVFCEAFGPPGMKALAHSRAPASDGAQTHHITFARSGSTHTWDGAVDSLLDLAEQHKVPMDSGCRRGACGTCLTAIRSGDVRYIMEPSVIPDPGSCLTCIAVPMTDVELDA